MATTLTPQQHVLAARLGELVDTLQRRDEEEFDLGRDVPAEAEAIKQEVRSIGEQLNSEGGFALMQAVGHRTAELSDNPRTLESFWHGIGEWQF